jgi:hypothetical protein
MLLKIQQMNCIYASKYKYLFKPPSRSYFDTVICFTDAEEFLHVALYNNYIPIELRMIVFDYYGKEHGFAEYIIYQRIVGYYGFTYFDMFHEYDVYDELKKHCKGFDIYNKTKIKDIDDKSCYMQICPLILLSVYEKKLKQQIQNIGKLRQIIN